ncbi:MAG: substrate-binding protein [Kiloniellaceae bacterium]
MLKVSRRRLLASGAAAAGAAAGAAALPGFATRVLAADPIRVGAVLPFSGGLELFGNQAKIGLDLAMKEINEAGGILGRPLEILYEDNRTDPRTSVEKARTLIGRDGAVALTGPILSSSRDAMAATVERSKVPLLYCTNYEGGACSRYIFSFNTVPNQELARLLPYMHETFGGSTYMFGADYVWPQKMFEAAQGIVAGLGGATAGVEFTPWGVKEFAPVIRRIADSGAKVLLFALPGGDGITFIKQAEAFGLFDRVTVAFLGFAETYLGAFGPGGGENMWVTVPFVASGEQAGVKDFVARVRAQAGDDVPISHYVMTHYNAINALRDALQRRGEVGPEAAVDGLEGLTVSTPTGPVSIGGIDHHVTLPMFLAKTEGAGLVTVRDLGRIAPESGC